MGKNTRGFLGVFISNLQQKHYQTTGQSNLIVPNMGGGGSKQACEQDQKVFIQFGLCKVHSPLINEVILDLHKKGHTSKELGPIFPSLQRDIILLRPSAITSLIIRVSDL